MHFNQFQQQIDAFIAHHKTEIKNRGTTIGLKTSDAVFCAEDTIRNRRFWQSIKDLSLTKNEDFVVVDAGCGLGILGLMTLLHGAKKVYFIESNPETLKLAKAFIKSFQVNGSTVEFIKTDATTVKIKEPFDVIISETISKDLLDEDFIRIIENLIPQGKSDLSIIPCGFEFQPGNDYVESSNTSRLRKGSKNKRDIHLFGRTWIKPGDCMSLGN